MDTGFDLQGVFSLATAGYTGAVAVVVGFVWFLLSRRDRKREELSQRDRDRAEQYRATLIAYKQAFRDGPPERVIALRNQLETMRRQGWHKLADKLPVLLIVLIVSMLSVLAVATVATLSGCASRVQDGQNTHVVPLGQHVRQLKPGAVLPNLPDGQGATWWVCSPLGLELLLPTDSPALYVQPETTGSTETTEQK